MTCEEGWSGLRAVALQTVGCKLNQAETESLARNFFRSGFQVVNPRDAADIYLLNTCTVTRTADHKCRKLLRLAHRRNPGAFIVATGCYAERAPSELNSIAGVELLIGNRDKEKTVDIVSDRLDGYRTGVHRTAPRELPHRTRSMVRIQEGCSQSCSFCIVPRVRGPERSRPEEEVVSEIKARSAEGYKEVVLTGTRIGRYGQDEGLPELIARILAETDIPRLRLSSLEPPDVTPALLRLWDDHRLCPHIHLPLQSGSDSVLERMGRPYSTAEYERAVSHAREAIPDLSLTTDIMVGFPDETGDEFNESHRFCQRIGFSGIHVFPYSIRPGTRAARAACNIEDRERKRRVNLMLDLASVSSRGFRNHFLGQTRPVLWEGSKGGIWYGLTDNYIRVFTDSDKVSGNKLVTTGLIAHNENGLWGEPEIKEPESSGVRG